MKRNTDQWLNFKRPVNYIEYLTLWLFEFSNMSRIEIVSELETEGITRTHVKIHCKTKEIAAKFKQIHEIAPFGLIKVKEIKNLEVEIYWFSSKELASNDNLIKVKNKITLNLESIIFYDKDCRIHLNGDWLDLDNLPDDLKIIKVEKEHILLQVSTTKGPILKKITCGKPVEVLYHCT